LGEECQRLINEEYWGLEDDHINQAILRDQVINITIELELSIEKPDEVILQFHHVQPVIMVPNNEERPEDCNRLPPQLIQYFQGIPVDRRTEILIDIQQLIDADEINIFEGVNQVRIGFLLMHRVRHAATYGEQIRQYIDQPILGRYVYYLLIINQHDEVMILIKHDNGHEFPKAYRRITNDGASESPKQAVVRVANQQIQVENQITHEIYDHVDFDEHAVFDPYSYLSCVVNQRHERVDIGLFICRIRTNILAFTPRDENIFQAIRFIPIGEMPEDTIGYDRDIYHTLQHLERDQTTTQNRNE
jgi:hypothetical protein